MASKFSKWIRWRDRNLLPNLDCPGVYAIARSRKNIAGQPFDWRSEIIYFGMSNAKGGLKSRLQQFENTISGKRGHGGAARVRFKHSDVERFNRLPEFNDKKRSPKKTKERSRRISRERATAR